MSFRRIFEVRYATDSCFIIRFYTSNFNPLVGIAQLKLGKILPHINEFQSALSHIREAGDILKVKKILNLKK